MPIEINDSHAYIGEKLVSITHPLELTVEDRIAALNLRADRLQARVTALEEYADRLRAQIDALENTPWRRLVRWFMMHFGKG